MNSCEKGTLLKPKAAGETVRGWGEDQSVLVAVAENGRGGGWLRPVDEAGAPAGPPERAADLAAAVQRLERDHQPRWLWAATSPL